MGDVPDCLKSLALTERILIQLVFPRIHLVKLRPKKKTSTGKSLPMPPSQLHDGLNGSVCSVQMPTSGILQMLEGTLVSGKEHAYLFGTAFPYYSISPLSETPQLNETPSVAHDIMKQFTCSYFC